MMIDTKGDSDLFHKGDVQLNVLQEHFLTIGMAKVSTSAHEAFDLGIMQKGKDVVVVNCFVVMLALVINMSINISGLNLP